MAGLGHNMANVTSGPQATTVYVGQDGKDGNGGADYGIALALALASHHIA